MIIPQCRECGCNKIETVTIEDFTFDQCKAYPGMEHLKWRRNGCPLKGRAVEKEEDAKSRKFAGKGTDLGKIEGALGYKIRNRGYGKSRKSKREGGQAK